VTVRSKLLASFGAVTTLLLVPGLFAANRLAELRDFAVEGRARHATAVRSLGRMQASLAELDRFERSFVATGDPFLRASAADALRSLEEEHQQLRTSPYQGPAAILEPVLERLGAGSAQVDSLMARGRVMEATDAFRGLELVFRDAERRLSSVADSVNFMAQRDFLSAEAISVAARRDTLTGLTLALLIALGVATWASATLTSPLRGLGRAMARVADGSFEPPDDLPAERRDEIGELSASFHIMSRRLAELNRMKAEFLGVATHELKTPINVIHGYAELIEEELSGEVTEQQRAIVHGIGEQAEVMSKLVSRLMDISRLEAGTYRMEWEEVRVEDLITGLLRRFELYADQKGVRLRSRVLEAAPRSLVMDVDIIRDEVLGNLVANALRHTPAGGRVEIVVDRAGEGAVFSVADTGPGIAEEHRDLIFQKHYQADAAVAGSSGLGLAIAKEMVELHGGFIWLEPAEPNTGATFKVVLPVTPHGAPALA
jgi:signal transduction histidine kinase